jgi:hypothetical protein
MPPEARSASQGNARPSKKNRNRETSKSTKWQMNHFKEKTHGNESLQSTHTHPPPPPTYPLPPPNSSVKFIFPLLNPKTFHLLLFLKHLPIPPFSSDHSNGISMPPLTQITNPWHLVSGLPTRQCAWVSTLGRAGGSVAKHLAVCRIGRHSCHPSLSVSGPPRKAGSPKPPLKPNGPSTATDHQPQFRFISYLPHPSPFNSAFSRSSPQFTNSPHILSDSPIQLPQIVPAYFQPP